MSKEDEGKSRCEAKCQREDRAEEVRKRSERRCGVWKRGCGASLLILYNNGVSVGSFVSSGFTKTLALLKIELELMSFFL